MLLVSACSPPPQSARENHPLPEDVDISEMPPGQYGGLMVLSESQEPKHFNPLVRGDAYTSAAISRMLSGLTGFDPIAQQVTPQLAREWVLSDDGLNWVFHLRRGVRWSDGTPFTADDVIFTFDALFDERYPNRYSQQYTIAGEPLAYEKIDDYTVRFTTADVYAPFLTDIGYIEILPRHKLQTAFEAGTLQEKWTIQTAIDEPAELVATGPFRLFSYRPGERMVYSPNPHYWRADQERQRLPYVDFLVVRFVASSNTETVLFATGQTDASSIPVADVVWVQEAGETYDFSVHDQGLDSSIRFLWFNQNPGSDDAGEPFVEPHKLRWFQDQRFRQAVAYGLDRPGLVRAVYFGRGEPLDSVISPANRKWHNPEVRHYPYDPQRARELLQEAGFRLGDDGKLRGPAGHPVSFELMTSEGSALITAIATTLKENMAELGIEVRLSYMDFAALISRVSDTYRYESSLMAFTGGGDPSGGKAIYRSDGQLHVWHPNQKTPATPWEARVDEIMDLQERTLDASGRIALIREMQDIFAEQLPLILLVVPNAYQGIRDRWQNVRVPPIGSVVWNIDELWTDNAEL